MKVILSLLVFVSLFSLLYAQALSSSDASELRDRINALRNQHCLSNLDYSDELANQAKSHAEQLAATLMYYFSWSIAFDVTLSSETNLQKFGDASQWNCLDDTCLTNNNLCHNARQALVIGATSMGCAKASVYSTTYQRNILATVCKFDQNAGNQGNTQIVGGGNCDGNCGGDNTGGDNTGGDNTGGDNTGGDNTGGESNELSQEAMNWVNYHNKLRKNCAPDVEWSNTLASLAQNWANQMASECRMYHSDRDDRTNEYNGGQGENLYSTATTGSLPSVDESAISASRAWGTGECDAWDQTSNTCLPNQVCGHLTQMIWPSSTLIGCASSDTHCLMIFSDGVERNASSRFSACRYATPGNYVGQNPFQSECWENFKSSGCAEK